MHERALLRLSLTMALGGLLAMAAVATWGGVAGVGAGSLSPDDVGRSVKVCGAVEGKFTSKTGHVFFTLTDESGRVKVVVFNSTKATIPQGTACVTGRVGLYEGDVEVVAREVRDA